MTRCIDCGGDIIEGEDHRCHTIARDWPMTTIIIEMEDEPVHTAANGYTCGEKDCPCSAEVEDTIRLSPPTEQELDAQELEELGTHAPDCRCGWCEPQDDPITSGPRRIDWNRIFDDGGASSRERDQERNITHQCADGSWW